MTRDERLWELAKVWQHTGSHVMNSTLRGCGDQLAEVLDDDDMPASKPDYDPIMAHFEYAHLPLYLQTVSKKFFELAHWAHNNLPLNTERSVALRKLLEGKDAAVRAELGRPKS